MTECNETVIGGFCMQKITNILNIAKIYYFLISSKSRAQITTFTKLNFMIFYLNDIKLLLFHKTN